MEAHHRVNSPDTGRNFRGRRKKNNRLVHHNFITAVGCFKTISKSEKLIVTIVLEEENFAEKFEKFEKYEKFNKYIYKQVARFVTKEQWTVGQCPQC